ncbi:MAG: glycosyl transferase family 2 [Mucilaginibacter sp.]|nr:glycosyl transferase family 2 [Mucilaginibacter sp.]
MIMNPLVSIALCTYNGEKFLIKQLDSLLSQEYANIEIIAVDDCSSDKTWNILRDYARKDKRLRIYQNGQNIGYSRNFERAVKLCSGDYIALADQDDIWEKSKIKVMIGSVEDHVMVYHNSDFIDEHDKRIGNSTMASKHRMYDGESCLPIILANCIHGHAILFDSTIRKFLFPFRGKFSHDWAICYVAFNIGSVKYIDKVLAHYRQHPNSITDFLGRRERVAALKKTRNLERLPVNTDWLNYCLKFKYKREPALVNEACTLFSDLTKGKNKLMCFIFMMKYFDLLFYTMGHKKRGFFSKINFVRKLCFS